MNKIENLISENEFKITFDYSKIKKIMFDAYMKFNSKVHDILSNSRHDVLFMTDLKYVYSIISLIEKCRHYFASIIFEINQIQSTRIVRVTLA